MWKCGTAVVAALLWAAPLSAQVVRLEITSRDPMHAGEPAGAAGPFELIRGRIHGEVDPRDPRNAIIQDLALAPRNARGKVRKAVEQAVKDRFRLPDDAARILRSAEASAVLQPSQPAASASSSCEQLTSMTLANATVTLAHAYPAGDFTSGRTFRVPAFCRVAVTAKPTSDSDQGGGLAAHRVER